MLNYQKKHSYGRQRTRLKKTNKYEVGENRTHDTWHYPLSLDSVTHWVMQYIYFFELVN